MEKEKGQNPLGGELPDQRVTIKLLEIDMPEKLARKLFNALKQGIIVLLASQIL